MTPIVIGRSGSLRTVVWETGSRLVINRLYLSSVIKKNTVQPNQQTKTKVLALGMDDKEPVGRIKCVLLSAPQAPVQLSVHQSNRPSH